MSHIARIELEIYSLEELRRACKQLGLTFCEGQQTYEWYGRWVGDAELPEGLSVDDLGKCDHAIKVPGATYEIGIKKIGSKYQLLYDYWHWFSLIDFPLVAKTCCYATWRLKRSSIESLFCIMPIATAGTSLVVKCVRMKLCTTQ